MNEKEKAPNSSSYRYRRRGRAALKYTTAGKKNMQKPRYDIKPDALGEQVMTEPDEDEYGDPDKDTCGNGPIFCGQCWRCRLEDEI